jgi:alkylation response protein AidB-like acyl-CoA dehydrogenase
MTLFAHAAQAAAPSWPEPAYHALLADSVAAPALVNSLRVEPDLGTPARGGLPATTARRDGNGWRLTGHKIYSTAAVALSRLVVFARTAGDERTPSALGRPLATLPRFQAAVGEIDAELTAAEDLLAGLAARLDAGEQALGSRAGAASWSAPERPSPRWPVPSS